jgi:outer membrane protein assembly factor BamE (lipoprotein component of BamABCDE complex)/uncharacterized protein YchJ
MRYLILLLALLSVSCSSTLPSFKTYKLDVQQGNVISAKMMLQLKPGMSKSQVRYVLGTPLLQDSFHPERWDYLYEMNRGGKVIERRRVVLEFSEQGLKMVRGDIIPAGHSGAENAPVASVEDVVTATSNKTLLNEDPQKSWWNRLKFWGDDEPVVKNSVNAPKVYEGEMKIAVDASAKPEPDLEQVVEGGAPSEESSTQSVLVVNQLDKPSVKEGEVKVLVEENKDVEKNSVQDLLIQRVEAWASAWRNKNITEYLSFYSSKFVPEGLTKNAWLAQRKQRLSAKQGAIGLTIENIQVALKDSIATVSFSQKFTTSTYSDQVIKSLVFGLENQQWKIVSETIVSQQDSSKANSSKDYAPASTIKEKSREEILNERTEGPPPNLSAPIIDSVESQRQEVLPIEATKVEPVEEMKPVEVKPSAKPVKKSLDKPVSKPSPSKEKSLPEEEEPGYFDRILEKIGF